MDYTGAQGNKERVAAAPRQESLGVHAVRVQGDPKHHEMSEEAWEISSLCSAADAQADYIEELELAARVAAAKHRKEWLLRHLTSDLGEGPSSQPNVERPSDTGTQRSGMT
ncbi:hypothetical protein NDU88_001089 [Pleurodeles waltl]|uniref:Uncharacterized protein n=1 Tax=Pleurodeles waltl TaxID=8319 RepID=A0AAV7NI06_PLEWA|nr:hypothetical protein NDU88_001089 [Pleurodeles waltl]